MRKEDHIIAIGLGMEFCLIMLLGTYAGYFLDRKFDTSPLCILFGVAGGFAIGLYILLKTALSYGKKSDEQNKGIKK